MGIIGKILGVGSSGIKDPNKLSASERIEARKIMETKERLFNRTQETIEKIKTRISEGKSEHVVNVLMNDNDLFMSDGKTDWTGPEFLKYFITLNPGLFSNEVLPTAELKKLNSVNSINGNSDLETQKQILELEKEKLVTQLEIERLKQSSNKVETNSTDSKINKLMSWGYSKEKANNVSDKDFERLEYWFKHDKKFFDDLLKIELNIYDDELKNEI